jgi:hypothetical protein
MKHAVHPFYTLRQQVRQAGKQYRYNNDNSDSLFHPKGGFVHAYDIAQVEAVLDAYELTLDTDYVKPVKEFRSPEQELRDQAISIQDGHPSLDARQLAGTVLAFLEQTKVKKINPLKAVEGLPAFDVDE